MLTLPLPNEAATERLAQHVLPLLPDLRCIYLKGDLGAGKTTWVRYLLRALGYSGRVKSPTYSLMETYIISQWQLLHMDCYRLQQAAEVLELGLDDYFASGSIFLIEWPEKIAQALPAPDIVFEFQLLEAQRQVSIELAKPSLLPLQAGLARVNG